MVKQVWSLNAESLYGVVKLDGIKHIVSQVQLKSSLVFCVIMASTVRWRFLSGTTRQVSSTIYNWLVTTRRKSNKDQQIQGVPVLEKY